jgi:ArsR family transcriptional regulator
MPTAFRQNLKYLAAYLSIVIPKKIESLCCPGTVGNLAVPPEVARGVAKAGGYDRLLSRIRSMRDLEDEARNHGAMADPVRLRILEALSLSDMCPCLLKKITGLTDSKLSYHLRILENAGLVRSRRSRNWRIYSLARPRRKKKVDR